MKVISIGAHPDDVELGMGGTLSKHIHIGDDVHIVLCTLGGVSGDPREREEEARKAASILGVFYVHILNYPVPKLNKPTLEFGEIMRKVIRDIKPHRIYVHSPHDYHQVHSTISRATKGAAEKENIKQVLYYEIIASTTLDFKPNAYVDITDYIDLKIRSIEAHKSQSDRLYMQPNVVRSLANIRYAREKVGSNPNGYAEAFTIDKLEF
jgi:LmbE family N-acetylglucosaminyl deacetylase